MVAAAGVAIEVRVLTVLSVAEPSRELSTIAASCPSLPSLQPGEPVGRFRWRRSKIVPFLAIRS